MSKVHQTKGWFVKGARRTAEISQYAAGLGARGLGKGQVRQVVGAYSNAVCSPPIDDVALEAAVKEAWKRLKTTKNQDRFKDLHTVEKKEPKFLIHPYLPDGTLTILDGNPGMGKSLVTTHLAAEITTGGRFAGREKVRRGRVLFMAPEDEADRILRPRLEAHGADVSKVRFMCDPFLLDDEGIELLRNELKAYRPELVIIDPLSAFIPPETDTFRANQVRGFMRPLALLAAEADVAILVVRHLRKASSESAIHMGQGSMDFIAAVRSGLVVVPHPADPSTRVFAQSKANWSRLGPSLTFEVQGDSPEAVPSIRWLATIDQSADQLMQGAEKDGAEVQAAKVLADVLKPGAIKARDAIDNLTRKGFSERTIDRAKVALGVISGRGPGAEWKLP